MDLATIRRSVVGTYCLGFILMALLIYGPYALTGTSLVWQADGIAQHLPALAQWQTDLQHLFKTGQFPTQWSWQLGLGSDYYQTFSYYVLGDVFTYPSVFFRPDQLVNYYNLSVVLRLFTAGLAFIVAAKHFLPHITRQQPWMTTLASLAYLFTGYTAFAGFEHPFFINPLILFPLLIVSLDRAFVQKKYGWLAVMVAWTLWNNYYFAFMLALGALIFWVIRVTRQKRWSDWRSHRGMVSTTLIGLLCALPLFLPSVLATMSSSRGNTQLANGLVFYPLYYYLSLPGTFIGNQTTPEFWLTGGFSGLALCALVYVLRRSRQYSTLTWIFGLAGLGLLTPIIAALFNGGSTPSNRWTFMLALPMSLAIMLLLDQRQQLQRQDYRWMFGLGLLMTLSIGFASNFSWKSSFGLVIALYFMTVLVLYLVQQKLMHVRAVFLVTLASLLMIMTRNHVQDLNPDKTTMLSNQHAQNLLVVQRYFQTSQVPTKTHPLNRVWIADQLGNMKGIAPNTNLPMLSPLQNIESYWSYQNGAVTNLMNQLQISTSNPNDAINNLDNRTAIHHVLGVKSRFNNTGMIGPANYQHVKNGVLYDQNEAATTLAYPLAYVPQHTIDQQLAATYTGTDREALLMDTVSIPDGPKRAPEGFINQIRHVAVSDQPDAKARPTTLNFTFDSLKAAKSMRQQLQDEVPADERTVPGLYLEQPKALTDHELHLELRNIRFDPYRFKQREAYDQALYQNKQLNLEKERADATDAQAPLPAWNQRFNPAAFHWNWVQNNLNTLGSELGGFTLTANYQGHDYLFRQTSKKNLSFYKPQTEATLNLGQVKKAGKKIFIPLTFSQPGTYSFDVTVKALPTGKTFKQVATAQQAQAVPVTLGPDHLRLTPKTIKQPTVIATTIPYSNGWSSPKHDVIKVNEGFIGVIAQPQDQQIDLYYHTPGLKTGLIGAVIGIGALLIMWIVRWFRRYRH